jgi:chromosome segregation ATPase
MSTLIETAAHALASAENRLNEAMERHQKAVDHRSQIHQRIVEAEDRRQDIRTQLADGDLTDREAGALLAAVDEDRRDLENLLAEAEQRVREAEPVHEREAVSLARRNLERAQTQAQFDALHARVTEIEQVFLSSLVTLHTLGTQIGKPHTLSASYRFSGELINAVNFGQPPVKRG